MRRVRPWGAHFQNARPFCPATDGPSGFEMSFTRNPVFPLIRHAVVTSQRLIVLLYFVLLIGGGVWAGAMLLEARAEFEQLKQVQAASEAKLAAAEARLREQEKILQRLRSDPAFVEKVIRKQLGYARPGEVIFRFDSGL